MSTHRRIDAICVIVMCIAVVITVLFMNGTSFGLTATEEGSDGYTATEYFTANEQNITWWQNRNTTDITLSDSGITVSGQGAYANDGSLYIKNAGYYDISGELSDGSIYVDAYNSSKVYIRLNGVNITRSGDAALRVAQADKVFLTLAEGTDNSFAMTSDELTSEASDDNVNAAIFARDNLVINGSGSLTVTGDYKHGITAKDDLVLYGAEISIDAKEDGIHVNDAFKCDATLSISCGDDGIHSDTSIAVSGGGILIAECYEGLEALTIDIYGGDITVYPTDDGFNANGGSDSFGLGGFGGGNFGGGGGFAGTEASENTGTDAESGAERPDMEQQVTTASTDSEDEETYIKIYDGNITIINERGNDADGLDSNKDIYVYGGNVRISMNNNGGNCAIDYGSESSGICVIDGGTVIACGSSSMVEELSDTSSQGIILYNFSSAASDDTALILTDALGNELLNYQVPLGFTSACISCPGIEVGSSYTVKIGDTEETVTVEEISASYGDAASSGMGMGGDMGGMNGGNGGNGGDRGDGGGMNRGGRMNMPDQNASDTSSGTQDTDFSQMTPPDMENGDFSGMTPPDMPDGDSSGMTPPDMPGQDASDTSSDASGETTEAGTGEDGSDARFGKMGMRGGMGQAGMEQSDADEDETNVSTGTPLSELGMDVWIYLIASVCVLLIGLVVVILFRKK